jgi:YHS domain-containing protein
MKQFILTLTALTLLAGAAVAQPNQDKAHPPAKAHSKAAKTALICPVTGTKIASTKDAVGHSMYKGKTYYFCCAGCKPKFDKDPAKFVKNAKMGKFEKM